MIKPLKKAIIPAAGFGTRFLPWTKSMPKEMLPLIDKPVIQIVVEELVAAGVEDIIIVTGYHKRSIEDYFDTPNADLVANLLAGGAKKASTLEKTRAISELANFIYVRQRGPQGNGSPILSARDIIGDDPFIYVFPDDFFVPTSGGPSSIQQMIDCYNHTGNSVVACKKVTEDKEYDMFGIADGVLAESGNIAIDKVAEKPGKSNAASDLAVVSAFLYTPDFMPYLLSALPEHDPELGEFYQYTGLNKMIAAGHRVEALEIKNCKYYDTGDKLGYLKTVIDLALSHPELGSEVRQYLSDVIV
jgi:UTP--glucose-1-phosphate uridylyltransferase